MTSPRHNARSAHGLPFVEEQPTEVPWTTLPGGSTNPIALALATIRTSVQKPEAVDAPVSPAVESIESISTTEAVAVAAP